jgi:hypothetical protein
VLVEPSPVVEVESSLVPVVEVESSLVPVVEVESSPVVEVVDGSPLEDEVDDEVVAPSLSDPAEVVGGAPVVVVVPAVAVAVVEVVASLVSASVSPMSAP